MFLLQQKFTSLFSAFIDVTSACQADVGGLSTGQAKLILEIVTGQNTQVKGRHDSNRANRMFETVINVNCGQGKMWTVGSNAECLLLFS